MIRRYKWDGGVTSSELSNQVPVGVTASTSSTNPVFTDIEILPNPVSADTAQDMDEYFTSLGWTFVEVDPSVGLPTSSAQLFFGAETVATNTTLKYLRPGYTPDPAPTDPVQFPLTRAGTLKNMYIHQTGDGNGTNLTYTVRINNVATALAVTMASTDSDAFNIVTSVIVSAGDLIDIEVSKAGGVGNSPDDIICTVGFES